MSNRTFEALLLDIRPLVRYIGAAQKEWLSQRVDEDPDGPYNEEMLIALMGIANSFAKAMMSRGLKTERLDELASFGRVVGDYIVSAYVPRKGTDA